MSGMSLKPAQMLFCCTLAFSVARTLPALVRFYEWFVSSDLEIAKHRGYGQTGSKAYGFIPSPKLSVPAMAGSGVAFALCLLLCNVSFETDVPRPLLLCLALVFYHLYFSQVYCEAHVGAHVTVMIPPTLIFLALSPALDTAQTSEDSEMLKLQAGAFTAWLVKAVIASSYCSAGVSKICSSIQSRRFWWDGRTLQASIFEALLLCRPGTHTSFGVPTPFAHQMQVFAYRRPKLLLAPLSFLSVAVEALAPLALLLPPSFASPAFAAVGLSFHYGIAYLQNVDFVSWWGPSYAFFMLDPAGSWEIGPLASARASFALAPCRTSLAVGYLAAHLFFMLVLHFFPSVEMLPFSCFPMFKHLKDLFDPSMRKWFWLSAKPHATGTLKNYCFPFCRPQTVLVEELDQLPFRYLLFGHGGSDAETLYSNFEVSDELRGLLDEMRNCCCRSDSSAAEDLLSTLFEAQELFEKSTEKIGTSYLSMKLDDTLLGS